MLNGGQNVGHECLGADYDSDAFHFFTVFGRGHDTETRCHTAADGLSS